jgi:hypothetical protein
MATQPFDEKAAAASREYLKNLIDIKSEIGQTLDDLRKITVAEQNNVDIAKSLGQVYKTQQDKINEQLKGKSLQEQMSLKLQNSEMKIEELSSARISSHKTLLKLGRDLLTYNAELVNLQGSNALSSEIKAKINLIEETETQLNLEKKLLSNSGSQLASLKLRNNLLKIGNDLLNVYNKALEMGVQLLNKMGDLAGSLMAKLNMPTTIVGTFTKILDIFNEIDTAATNVRQKFGLLPSQGAIFEKNIREASIQLAEFGINAEQLGGTMKQIGSTFTSLQSMEKGLVKDVSIMSAQFGISAETSAKFLQTLGGVSGKSAMAKQNMLGLAKFAANAYGVGLDDVMSDVANASDAARMYAGKNADELVRAAAQARQMGTTLDNMANTAKGLLDFESSIQSELKASALIGKNINFNEARRLAFQGDIIGANKLILDQAKKIKFNQLNPIAQDAFAKAAGKTVKELQEMLNAEENLKEALKSKDPLVRAEAEKKKQMAEMMKKDPIAAKKAAQAEYEKGLIQEKNQTRMKQLQNEINAIFMEFIGPILEGIGPIFTELLKYIKDNRAQIKEFAQEIGKAFLIFKNLEYIALIFKKIDDAITGTTESIKAAKSVFTNFKNASVEFFTIFKSGTSSIANSIGGVIKSTLKWLTTSGSLKNSILNVAVKIDDIAIKIMKFSDVIKNSGNGFQTMGNVVGSIGKGVGSIANGFLNTAGIVEKITNKFSIFAKMGSSIGSIGGKVSGIFSGFNQIFNVSGKITGVLGSIKNVLMVPLKMLGSVGKAIGGLSGVSKIFTSFGPLFGGVAKFLGPIGIVISVIQGGIAFFKAFSETTGTTSQKAVAGLKAVINVLVIEPLKMVWDFLKKIPSFLANIDFAGILKDVTNFLLDGLTSLPDKIEELFSGGGGGIEWGKIFANIARLAIELIVAAFVKLPIAIYKTVGKLGLLILKAFGLNAIADGIASIADTLYTTLKWPFEAIYNWVMDKLGGKSPSKIGLAIVDGIKSVVDMLFDVLTYPFKKAAQIIPELIDIIKTTYIYAFKSIVDTLFELITYPFRKGFDLVKSIISEVITFIKDIFSGAFTFLVDAFKSDSGAMFDLITNSFRKAFELVKSIISEVGAFIKDIFNSAFTFLVDAFKSVSGAMFDILTYPFRKGFELVKSIISGVGALIKDIFSGAFTFLVDALKSVSGAMFDLITNAFRNGFDLVKSIISEVGALIKDIFSGAFTFLVDALKSVSGAMFDLITNAFRNGFELVKLIVSESGSFIKDVFSLSFDFIIQSLKKVVDVMFDLITYPFKKAFQLIKSAVSEVGSVLKDTFSGAFTFIINALEKVWEKLKGVGGFITDLVGKGFSFVGKILGVTDEPTNESTGKSAKVDEKNKGQGLQTDSIINAIVSSNKAVVEKLDKLTSMMASGQIAVYIDGQRANQLLATSNSKFGSFGQATTN